MALLIIREIGQQDRRYQIKGKECIIGRDDKSNLVLPHTTVSRKHAKIARLSKTKAFIQNLSEGGTILVNGETEDKKEINTRDTIQIGKFTLVYFGDSLSPMDHFFEGKSLEEFPLYSRTANATKGDTTFSLSKKDVEKMLKESNTLRSAHIFSEEKKQSWFPEKKILSFGKNQDIPVDGWFTGGQVATISWDGAVHQLEKKSAMVKITVNGQKLSGAIGLNHGDRIQIGKSVFLYQT